MKLQRSLTLFGALMLVVGNVVGAGIFTTSGTLAGEINNPIVFMGVWVLGGVLTIAGALTYAELGAIFPRAGGDYQFLREAYGPLAGFLIGWLNFWVISPGSIAALSIAFVGYIPNLSLHEGSIYYKLLAVLILLFLSFVNYRSVKLASSMQSAITVGSLLLLVGLMVGGVCGQRGEVNNFVFSGTEDIEISQLLGPAMVAVLFTYSGWFAAAYVGSEVKKPERNVPLALFLGTVIVTVLYTGVNGIYLYALPLDQMKGTTNVAQIAAIQLFGKKVAIGVSIAVLLAIASCINGTIMTGARICYAMAEDRLFPRGFRKVHKRFFTPYMAIVVQGVIASIFVLLGTFDALLGFVVFAMMLSCMATGIAHMVLRIRRPELLRPYRTFGYPVVPLTFVLTYFYISVSIAIRNPVTSFIGLGFAFTGIPFFYWFHARGRQNSQGKLGKIK